MRKAIVSGVMFALLAGTAMAQSAPATPPATPSAMDPTAKAPPPPLPPGPGGMNDAGPDGRPGPGPRADRMPPPPPPPPARAAHFRLERGDTALDVKCAEDEPMKSCADIALQMLDKMQTLPSSKP